MSSINEIKQSFKRPSLWIMVLVMFSLLVQFIVIINLDEWLVSIGDFPSIAIVVILATLISLPIDWFRFSYIPSLIIKEKYYLYRALLPIKTKFYFYFLVIYPIPLAFFSRDSYDILQASWIISGIIITIYSVTVQVDSTIHNSIISAYLESPSQTQISKEDILNHDSNRMHLSAYIALTIGITAFATAYPFFIGIHLDYLSLKLNFLTLIMMAAQLLLNNHLYKDGVDAVRKNDQILKK